MRNLVLATAALFALSIGLAEASGRHARHAMYHHSHYAHHHHGAYAPVSARPLPPREGFDPYVVILPRGLPGRDPDWHVRFEMLRDWARGYSKRKTPNETMLGAH